MNRALLDTDILSYYLRGDENVVKNLENYMLDFEVIEISIITYYEVVSGLLYKNALKQIEIFHEFVSENIVIPLTEESCKISGNIYSKLRQTGDLIDDIDLLIAGIAIENEMSIITNNENHFRRIPGLKVENWKK
ncbi:MAG: type II toxin-antitoxin system VapC family toxin [Bacteroidetes bacterium]|nr:MAG: type II toxin-antitoxin system VapC family toxin [Bacteroidota bacterium]